MNTIHKRLKLSPSRPAPVTAGAIRPSRSGLQIISHDALLLLPPPAAAEWGGAEEKEEDEEEEGYLLVEEDTTDSSLIITMEDSQVEVKSARRRAARKRRRKPTEEEGGASESEEEEEEAGVEIDRQLDQSLETKSKQHNLTTVNVRNIIHEVITNEHVVAMMKAAINETEAVPPFEPKMTRSKFKEVVEKGVVIPAWNISPIKKPSDVNKAPQFVDIPLAEEDSSDEEYRPDEDDEDETAEDTFQESDMESTASSPRGSRLNRVEEDSCSPWQTSRSRSRHLRAGHVSMGPPPPPKAPPTKAVTDSTFLEKLHAVEEELAVWMEPYQPLSESEDEVGLMAYRTRSKRPLRDVPLGRLEAELRAPDITPDMYDSSSAHEDREWTDWLRGLMTSDMDNEEECDDEDDPEYNFLADIDEPDQEDYRDDKAVRITKKEVNELMEELFETLKEDLAGQGVDDEGHEEEEEPHEEKYTVHTHTTEEHNIQVGDEDVQDGPITELRTVKQQLVFLKKRRLSLQTHTLSDTHTHSDTEPHTLKLDTRQRSRLQQHLQQHVQLLTQIHLLSSPVAKLHSEAETTRQFLFELDVLAQRGELLMSSGRPGFCSIFRASNLQGALQLLEELRQTPINYQPQHRPPDARGHMRCYPVMPAELAWLFATRPVFLYPELLPSASLDPALYCPRRTAAFTAAEDCLLVLGLRNMEGSCDPTKLVSQFLLRKTLVQVRRRILQCCRPGVPDNIVKAFRYQRVLWPMMVACRHVPPAEQRPPVEREERVMPLWLVRSLPVIYPTIKHYNSPPGAVPEALPPCRSGGPRHLAFLRSTSDTYSFPPGTRYPPRLPKHLDFRRIGFIQLHQPPAQPEPSPLSDRQADSSPLPDGQVDSSPLSDRQVDSSPLSDRQVDSSPLPDGQVDSSPLSDRQVDSSTLRDRQVHSSPLSDRQVDSSPLTHRQVDSSALPDRQVDSSPLSDRQVDSSALPDRQVDSSPLTHRQVDSSPLSDRQVDSSPLTHRQVDSSALPDRQVDSSALPDRQVDSSPLSDRQVDSSALPDRQVDSSPLSDRQVDSSALPDRQVDSSALPDRQVDSSALPDRQVDSSPLSDRQVDSSPLSDRQVDSAALSPSRGLLRRLLLSRTDPPADITINSSVSMTTTEQIRCHYQTLTSLRKRRHDGPAPSQVMSEEEEEEKEEREEEEKEEESEVLLALSESSLSSAGSVALDNDHSDTEEAESEREQEVTLTASRAEEDGERRSDGSRETFVQQQEKPSSDRSEEEDDEDDQRESEDELFAQDYLLRVCDAVRVSPGVSEQQVLQVLDQFSAAGPSGAPEVLYDRLSGVLRPWPQLLRDFAAFLNRGQACRCGLLVEQQLFERSRRFLRRLGRSLGEGSALYQQVVSVLQGSSTPSPEDIDVISSLLKRHPDLREEFWEFFQQLRVQSSPVATGSDATNPPDKNRKTSEESETGSDREEEEEEEEEEESGRAVCAKKISMTSSGEKVVVWTREADRTILTACKQRGANRKTFRHVSALLGNRTAQQVSLRFHHLMNLFHSAFIKSEGQPISTQEAALD